MNAVYAGSFDPLTLGHMDIIKRATSLFSKVHVLVAESDSKKPLFTIEERILMIRDCCSHLPVVVQSTSGLTIEYCRQHNIKTLVRGLRSGADYTFEAAMAQMNRHLEKNIETVLLTTKAEYFHLSSSLVKDIARHHGPLEGLVPPLVKEKLTEKFAN